ncbi:MAG: 30S ribosomal protein S27e [Aeropyrum sp.]|nr:30S ribosomal protein S27e [Aeropyrum sp.]MCE4616139.1 30S ribosomal protein S27e [Aeropyrum sp.]
MAFVTPLPLKRKKVLIPRPKSRFLLVTCPKCGNRQVVFSHATFGSRCLNCGEILVVPTGGKARILGRVERIYG